MIRLVHVVTAAESLLFLAGQMRFMQARGFCITVVTSPGKGIDEFREREGVNVHAISMPRRITPLRDLTALNRLTRLMSEIQPQIVHAHTPKGGLLGTIAARIAGIPVRIYQMRGLPLVTATGMRRKLLTATERVSCQLATHVLCNSRSLRDVAVTERLCESKKIEVLLAGSGNGVDASARFNPDRLPAGTRTRLRAELGIEDGSLVLGFVGRLVRDKGVGELVSAWRELREQFKNCHLLVVGPFEPRDPVAPEHRQMLEHDPRVHLLGWRTDLPELYSAMDLVILPTYREGFPNVPLEAAAMKLPVVTTRIPGCLEAVLDGSTGTLVAARDATGLRLATARYLGDPGLRHSHGLAGRNRVLAQFDRERLWTALEALYRRLLRQSASPSSRASNELGESLR